MKRKRQATGIESLRFGQWPFGDGVESTNHEWQPWETRPRDGTRLICWDGQEMEVLNQPLGCAPGRWTYADGKWTGSSLYSKLWTHWITAPLPPTAKAEWDAAIDGKMEELK